MSTDLPEGYIPISDTVPAGDAPPPVTMMIYENWRGGGHAVYHGQVELSPEEPSDRSRVHTFRAPEVPNGQLFGLWRSALLDRQLKHVRSGEVIYLRYEGMGPHPTLPGGQMHTWTVARESKAAPIIGAPKPPAAGLPPEFTRGRPHG